MNNSIKERSLQAAKVLYRIFIEPKSDIKECKHQEFIFNIIAISLFVILCLLELSITYSDITSTIKDGFNYFSFSVFILFFGSLLLLSRKGHATLATYLLLGLYFLTTTWGEYIWGIAIPIDLLSYGIIIIMASIILGARAGFLVSGTIITTLITIGYLETNGFIKSDITWIFTPLQLKDTIEDSFVFGIIIVISWLSNCKILKLLKRAEQYQKELKTERDLLEIKVEERTKELKDLELEKIAQLYKFVEFGKLSSGIFHDLINPLSAVAMSVEKIKDDNTKEYVNKAIKASKRMKTFMLTAKKQLDSTEKQEQFLVNKEIEDAIDLLLHKSRKNGVEIIFSAQKEIMLYGNPIKLFQIIVNLISNAIDSYDNSLNSEFKEKLVFVNLSDTNEIIKIIITDKGSGIKPEIIKTIFEPFFSTKNFKNRQDSGLGLGLSTTKEHIEKDFGGKIELETILGKGTKFIVIIPKNKTGSLIAPTGR